MLSEIELYFQGDFGQEPYMTVNPVEASCPTELMNVAYNLQQAQRADHVSFGPVIERDKDGLPLVERKRP